jgi:hypothetical protein
MRKIVDPRQIALVDPYEHVLSLLARKRLETGWPGVFRKVILKLMPASTLADRFHASMGAPTKELYSMAGLMFIMEFKNWTAEQAADAYMFDVGIQYALNLEPAGQSMSSRTVERYRRLFRELELAAGVQERVTKALIEALELSVAKQRTDSTHIFSDMAMFGRTQLVAVTVKRFLAQVLRHDRPAYDALPEDLRARYAPSASRLFGDTARDAESRRNTRQQVAQDMYALIKQFAEVPFHTTRTTYKNLERVFSEQCDVVEERVEVKEKAGSRVMQNPSDPDATYDGKKGPGYQVQTAETCDENSDVQLITAVLPQTAADTDPESYTELQDLLAENGHLPETMLADTSYGSDDNVQAAQKAGVELVSPVNVSKRDPDKLHLDDFTIDAQTEQVLTCPAGHAPLESVHDPKTEQTTTRFDADQCARCSFASVCPVTGKQQRSLKHTPAQRRRAERFQAEQTPEFRKTYAKRAGIEGTFRRLKQCTGLGRLRVRGEPAVFNAIYLKIAGWNVMQAAKSKKMREILAHPGKLEALHARLAGVLGHFCVFIKHFIAFHRCIRTVIWEFRRDLRNGIQLPPQRLPLLSALSLKGDQGGCSF